MAESARKGATSPGKTAPSLVATVRTALVDQIEKGQYDPGDRLPSEARLTEEFSVSRTVIREAIASLRADRLVESRQGSGVFVLAPETRDLPPFRDVDPNRVSSVLEILEIRTAVETEAAALAAVRRSPAQVEELVESYREFENSCATDGDTIAADFRLHMAIAEAANNARFPEFLLLVGRDSIPRRALHMAAGSAESAEYMRMLCAQHEAIVTAILDGDEEAARNAMRIHLRSSQDRYRKLLRRKV